MASETPRAASEGNFNHDHIAWNVADLSEDDAEWVAPYLEQQFQMGELLMAQPVTSDLPTDDPRWYEE